MAGYGGTSGLIGPGVLNVVPGRIRTEQELFQAAYQRATEAVNEMNIPRPQLPNNGMFEYSDDEPYGSDDGYVSEQERPSRRRILDNSDSDEDMNQDLSDEEMGNMEEDVAEEVEEDVDEEATEEDEQRNIGLDEMPVTIFDPVAMRLKEINNLARFRVSTFKPGNGVEELLSEDLEKYWQSDGVQPHYMTIKFTRMVEIRAIRFYVDFNQDESYTPTVVIFHAGTSEHDLVKFATSQLANPAGWQDVTIAGSGGGDDGDSLNCMVIQMQIKENHQNGKDTHIRGIKIYGFDDRVSGRGNSGEEGAVHDMAVNIDKAKDRQTEKALKATDDDDALVQHTIDSMERRHNAPRYKPGEGGLSVPDFMEELVIR